eukprot:4088531-Pleurochrysis_carterae.AAC.2
MIKLGCWPTRAPLRGTAPLSEKVGSVSDQTWPLPYSDPISAPGQLGTTGRAGWLLESGEYGENAYPRTRHGAQPQRQPTERSAPLPLL